MIIVRGKIYLLVHSRKSDPEKIFRSLSILLSLLDQASFASPVVRSFSVPISVYFRIFPPLSIKVPYTSLLK